MENLKMLNKNLRHCLPNCFLHPCRSTAMFGKCYSFITIEDMMDLEMKLFTIEIDKEPSPLESELSAFEREYLIPHMVDNYNVFFKQGVQDVNESYEKRQLNYNIMKLLNTGICHIPFDFLKSEFKFPIKDKYICEEVK